MDPDVSGTHLQELRRGTVVLACLVVLRTPDYGYALLERLNELGFGPFVGMHLEQMMQNVEALQSSLRGLWNMEHMPARAEPSVPNFSFGKGTQGVSSSSFNTGIGPPVSQTPFTFSFAPDGLSASRSTPRTPSAAGLPGPTDISAQSRIPLAHPSFTPAPVLDPSTVTPRPPVNTSPALSRLAALQPTVPTPPVLPPPPSLPAIPEQVDNGRNWANSGSASSFESSRHNTRRRGPRERRKTSLNQCIYPVSSEFTFAKEVSSLFHSQTHFFLTCPQERTIF